jgi:hypothetical protein
MTTMEIVLLLKLQKLDSCAMSLWRLFIIIYPLNIIDLFTEWFLDLEYVY